MKKFLLRAIVPFLTRILADLLRAEYVEFKNDDMPKVIEDVEKEVPGAGAIVEPLVDNIHKRLQNMLLRLASKV